MKLSQPDILRDRVAAITLLLVLLLSVPAAAAASGNRKMTLTIANQISGEIYLTADIEEGDELIFGWEHSFEHVTWNEYYEVLSDGTLKLNSIALGGFGAGIPAEMDCTYRYEDGLIYMEDLEESSFSEINWIHSQTQVKFIGWKGEKKVYGTDLPQREKIRLSIR